MTKKITMMMLFLLLFGAASFSQTASLATVTASPGETKAVALNVTGFTGIGSITFNIRFNPNVMTFIGTTNTAGGVTFYSGVTDSTLNLVWTGYPYVSFPNGKLLDLNFIYNGMTTSPLNFLGSCEVTQGVTEIHPTYTNGSVSMAVVPQTATLVGTTASTGGYVPVEIVYASMPGTIGAVTQKIHYDPTKLNFISVTGVGTLYSGTNYSANISTGVVTITWTNSGGTAINYPTSKFILNFNYIGSTSTNIDFIAGCIISTASPVTNVPVTYYGGTVSLAAPTATAVLGSISGALQGQDYEVPMTLSGFPSGTVGGTQAFTLTIPYDSPRLSYLGIKSPAPSGLVVSQAAGTLTLAWTNPAAPSINGTFLTLKFKYNGIGTANVSFGNGCVFNTYNAGVVGTVQVAYTNSTFTPATVTPNASIGFVPGTAGSNVLVPVNFDGLPVNMGAATLHITYDYNKLTYVDAQNNIHGANVTLNATTHVINVAWAAGTATNINGKFIDLRFTYNGGGVGDCGAVVRFTDGCELADYSAVIVPANWNNGGVSLKFKVSGILSYNNDPSPEIPLEGFTVNLLTNPGDVLVASTITDATGYYEFWTFNGNYKLTAAAPAGYVWYADFDDVLAMFDYTFSVPIPYQNDLRVAAGDVNMNGDIDFDDVLAVFDRTFSTPNPEYIAPDWIFENPTFIVDCADLPGTNFMGLNTGDVLGTNTTPNP
jgi:hypothetical protein